MDPLEIFYDIHELIVQHLSFDEIFKASQVSTLWHDLVLERCKFAMRKTRLHVEDCNHDEVLKVLGNKESKVDAKLFELLSTKRKYQNIKIMIDHGWDFADQIVRNLSNFLVDIEVSSDIYVENLKIPNLKFLKLNDVLLDGLTTCSNKLIKLSASQTGKEFWLKKESPAAIKRALIKNERLQILELDETLTETIFSEGILANLRLKEFTVNCVNCFEILDNLRNFMGQFKSSLTYLHLGSIDTQTLQWIFENLTALKFLQFKIHFDENPRDFNLTINKEIKALDIDITSHWQWTMNIKYALRKFIASSPNLEILIIRMPPLDLDDFRFILVNATKLRKFKQNVGDYLNTYQQVYEQMCESHENVSTKVQFSNIFH